MKKYEVVCNLRKIMDKRKEEGDGISIRQLAERSNLKFETVRKMYNDDMKQYHRESLAVICVTLGVDIDELLSIVKIDD